MKKIFSLFAALLMLLSVVSVAFAEEADAEELGAAEAVIVATEEDFVVAEDVAADESGDIVATGDGTGSEGDSAVLITPAPETQAEPETAASSEEVTVTPQEVEDAGVTPDNRMIWGIDRAFERISLALTLNKAAKARKGIAYAKERLAELKLMVRENKADAAEKAAEAEQDDIADAEQAASEISSDNPEEELALQNDIQSRFQAQYEHTAQVKDAILARMQAKWTPEKYQKISDNFARMEARHKEVKDRLVARQAKIEAKVQAKTGKTIEEVRRLSEKARESAKEDREDEQEPSDGSENEPSRENSGENQSSEDAEPEESPEEKASKADAEDRAVKEESEEQDSEEQD